MTANTILKASADDVRAAARRLLAAIDGVKEAEGEVHTAASELAFTAENWNAAKLAHAVTNEAEGLLCDYEDRESGNDWVPLDHLRKETLEFLELVDLAAADA